MKNIFTKLNILIVAFVVVFGLTFLANGASLNVHSGKLDLTIDEVKQILGLGQFGSGGEELEPTSIGTGATSADPNVTYVTDVTDDFAVGGTNSSAPLYFDTSAGDLDIDGNLVVGANATTTGSFSVQDSSGNSLFVVDSPTTDVAEVGVGVTNPSRSYGGSQAILEIEDNVNPALVIHDTGQGSEYQITAESNELSFRYGASAVLLALENNNEVGINTNNPTNTFHVEDGSGNTLFTVSDAGTTGNATTTGHFTADSALYVKDSKVGIGGANPDAALHILGTALDGTPTRNGIQISRDAIEITDADGLIDFQNDTSGTDYDIRLRLIGDNTLAFDGGWLVTRDEPGGLIVDNGANRRVGFMKYNGHEAGIWRTSSQDFEIGRTDKASLETTPTGFTTDLYISGTGNVGVSTTSNDFLFAVGNSGMNSGDTSFTNTSHSKFKENISDFDFGTDYLEKFYGVKVKNFKYKDDYAEANHLSTEMRTGLLADEFNPLVGYSSEKTTLSGDDKFNALWEAVRQLINKVFGHDEEIEQLNKRIEKLEALLGEGQSLCLPN